MRYLDDMIKRMEDSSNKKDADGNVIQKGKLQPYRSGTADFKTHHFKASLVPIRKGIIDRLTKKPSRGYGLSQQQVTNLFERIDLEQKIKDSIRAIRDSIAAQKKIQDRTGVVTITTPTFNGNSVSASFIGLPVETGSVYKKITVVYQDIMENLARDISTAAQKVVSRNGVKKSDVNKGNLFAAKGYWELSHGDEEGALESYLRAGLNDSIEAINRDSDLAKDGLTPLEVAKAMNALQKPRRGVRVQRVIRESGVDEMNVFIGGFHVNKLDSAAARDAKKYLLQDLKEARKFLEDNNSARVADLPGSDSFSNIKRKKTIKEVIKPFKKIPGLEVKTENIKIKTSKTEVERKSSSAKPRVTKGKSAQKKIKQKPLSMSKRGMASPVRLMSLINAKLPQTVASNMGAPRLENRTGRFAASPRVVDVQQTPQGFPSIGYTYEKNPYSVFERTSGTRFADANRDPRDLIELSIREIAQQLTIGRFYTRRV